MSKQNIVSVILVTLISFLAYWFWHNMRFYKEVADSCAETYCSEEAFTSCIEELGKAKICPAPPIIETHCQQIELFDTDMPQFLKETRNGIGAAVSYIQRYVSDDLDRAYPPDVSTAIGLLVDADMKANDIRHLMMNLDANGLYICSTLVWDE